MPPRGIAAPSAEGCTRSSPLRFARAANAHMTAAATDSPSVIGDEPRDAGAERLYNAGAAEGSAVSRVESAAQRRPGRWLRQQTRARRDNLHCSSTLQDGSDAVSGSLSVVMALRRVGRAGMRPRGRPLAAAVAERVSATAIPHERAANALRSDRKISRVESARRPDSATAAVIFDCQLQVRTGAQLFASWRRYATNAAACFDVTLSANDGSIAATSRLPLPQGMSTFFAIKAVIALSAAGAICRG